MTEEPTSLTVQEQPRQRAQIVAGGQVGALVPQTLEEAYRLADAMSRSGMTPASIKTPEAVLVAIMAGAELGFPPFQALQSFAVINGRPSIWGDAIPALLWSSGFKLKEWFDNEDATYPDEMIARCEVTRPDGQVIEGAFSVADAKEAGLWAKSGPWQTAKKRMLKMRARSFAARDGASDVLRGLFVAEEAADFTPIGPEMTTTGTGMVERLKANAAPVDAAGFNVRQIAETTEAAKPKRQYRKKGSGNEMLDAIAEVEPEMVAQVIEDHGAELDEVLEGDAIPQDLGATETATAPIAETEVGMLASAMGALSGSAVETSGPIASDEQSQSGEPEDDDAPLKEGEAFRVAKRNVGPAPVGEVYILTRAIPDYQGKVATFKDGQPFSKVGRKGALLLNTYDSHSEAAATAPEKPQEPVQEVAVPNAPEVDASPFAEFWKMLQAAPTWDQTKKVVKALHVFEEFRELSATDKNLMRAQIWLEVESKELSVDVAYDPTAFRLWLETQEGRDGADAITGNFRVLKSGDLYQGMSGESQDVLEDVVSAAIARLRS